MGKFCVNCGQKLNENAAFCVNCGVAVNNANLVNNTPKPSGKGTSIASMVLGIIGSIYSLMTLLIFSAIFEEVNYFDYGDKIVFAFIFLLIPVIISVTGLVLGLINKEKVRTGISLTGLILGYISVGLCVLSVLLLILM